MDKINKDYKIVAATKNKGKLKEILSYFKELDVEIISMEEFEPLPEAIEDGATFLENAIKKARFYGDILNLPCLADDSGLVVDALGGAPGVYSARYAGEYATDKDNNEKLISELIKRNLKESPAKYVCSIALYNPSTKEIITSEGFCEGIIKTKPQGNNGFGYDPYFYLEDFNTTMADITLIEKNKISHRSKALRKIVDKYGDVMKC